MQLAGGKIERLACREINARLRLVVAGDFGAEDRVPAEAVAPREIGHQRDIAVRDRREQEFRSQSLQPGSDVRPCVEPVPGEDQAWRIVPRRACRTRSGAGCVPDCGDAARRAWRRAPPGSYSSIAGWYSPRQASANADQSRSKPRGASTARASRATPVRQSTRVPNTSKNNALGFAGTLYPSRFAVLGLKRATRVEVNRGDGPRALPLAGWLWHNARRFGPLFKVPHACCRSSVVEHSLGKGEVDSSILSGSTIKSSQHQTT